MTTINVIAVTTAKPICIWFASVDYSGYGDHCYWACAVCDVTLWHKIYICNPMFWKVCWHHAYPL